MPPKVIAKAKEDRTTGVLPVNAAARATPSRAPTVRLKLEIRRLPPGLTLTEFEEILGEEWKLGNGRVDWREYRQGKIKSLGKSPEQSRCYLHLTSEALVKEFDQMFLGALFHDKAGTHKNPDLRHLPPTLGFAPNQRTPLNMKQRADNRQGTIDQDPEFIAFLEAETQPIVKPAALDASLLADKENVPDVISTPLIDDLREKKANKAKAAANKADKKKAGGEEKKAPKGEEDRAAPAVKAGKDGGGKQPQQQKAEHAAKEAAKVLTKQAQSKQQQQQITQAQQKTTSPGRSKKAAPPSPKPPSTTPVQQSAAASTDRHSGAPQRGPSTRPRGNAEGIKKMLQKDLGIKPKAAQPAAQSPAARVAQAPTATPFASTALPSRSPPPSTNPTQPEQSAPTSPVPSLSQSAGARAYLKHANPSQGMTEILILKALSAYGDVTNVTIDPRKGTAIAVFKDMEGLKKALEAKKVSVSQGAVEVLEFKEVGQRRVGGEGARGRGGFRGGRGRGGRGGADAAATVSTPAPAPASSGI